MNMRKQLIETTTFLTEHDEGVITLLGDIGVYGFKNLMEKFPDRVYNIGILEQSMIGLAAGLSLSGLIPVVHTIAPFIVERAYEQLKLDFGYQKLNGNFVSVGASYDYAKLGSTHYCPGDIGVLHQIPNMDIIIPGTSKEFDSLYKAAYKNGKPSYYRLSEKSNAESVEVQFGKAYVLKRGTKGTVIAVGNTLDKVIGAVKDLDVTILYYSTIQPFDRETLRQTTITNNILMVEPYYKGSILDEIWKTFEGESIRVELVGIPREFLINYGSLEENDRYCEITETSIRGKMEKIIYG